MKRILVLLVTIVSISCSAQTPQVDTSYRQSQALCGVSAPYIQKMNDEFWKKVQIQSSDPFTPINAFPANGIQACGNFRLFYEDFVVNVNEGFQDPVDGVDRMNTFCAVLTYVQSVLQINLPANDFIDIHVRRSWNNTNFTPPVNLASALAVAGPYNVVNYCPNCNPAGIFDGFAYDHITTGVDPSPGNYDMEVRVNFSGNLVISNNNVPFSWWNNYLNTTGRCNYDLFSVLLHETTHGLGFISNINEDINFNIQSAYTNNQFTLYDWMFLHYNSANNDLTSAGNFQKLVTGSTINPVINGTVSNIPNLIRTQNIWLYPNNRPLNQPVYSGNYSNVANFPSALAVGSLLSHLDEQVISYTGRGRISPGFSPLYSMGPFSYIGQMKREWSFQEIRALVFLGYTLNPMFVNLNVVSTNTPSTFDPTNATLKYTEIYNGLNVSFVDYPEDPQPNTLGLVNNSTGQFINISVSTDPNFVDANGDVVRVEPGSIINFRGCGNGGNNNNCLQITNGGQNIVYTPRADFYGRAQFGFHLWDGKERGSFVVYTIDVTRGGTFQNTPATELVLNGGYEEGTQTKQIISDEFNPNSIYDFGLEGKYCTGLYIGDSHPYGHHGLFTTPTGGGDNIFNSASYCSLTFLNNATQYKGSFGSRHQTWPNSNNYPFPPANAVIPGTERFHPLDQTYNYQSLASDATNCTRYILQFDIAPYQSVNPLNGTITFNAQFTSQPLIVNPIWNLNIPLNFNCNNQAGWQHVSIPFTYCGPNSSQYMNLGNFSIGPYTAYMDNVSLTVDNSPFPLTANPTATPTAICLGGNSQLNTVVANTMCTVTYNWTPAASLSNTTIANPIATPTATTTYQVSVNDGCRITVANVTVTVNPLPVFTIAPASPSICPGSSVVLIASNNSYTYSWSPATGLSATTGSQVTATPISTITYTAFSTDVNGCTSSSTVTVTVVPQAICNTCTTSSPCQLPFTSLVPNGDFEYYTGCPTAPGQMSNAAIWFQPGTGSSDYENNCAPVNSNANAPTTQFGNVPFMTCPQGGLGYAGLIPYGVNNSSYREYIETQLNCPLEQNQLYNVSMWVYCPPNVKFATNKMAMYLSPNIVTQNNALPINVIPQVVSTGVISTSNGWTQISNPSYPGNGEDYLTIGSFVDDVNTTAVLNGGALGSSYYNIDNVSVTPVPPAVSSSTNSFFICQGGNVTLTASGSPGYSWAPATGLSATSGSTVVANPTVTTVYTVYSVLNCSNCIVSTTFTITVGNNPIITITPSNPTVCAGAQVQLTATGGTSFSWAPSPTLSCTTCNNPQANPTATTTYTVFVTGQNGCSSSASVTVTVLPSPTVTVSGNTTICNGGSTTLTASGANSYSWSTGATIAPITVSPTVTTTYTVTGTGVNNCTGVATITVTVNPVPTITITPSNQTICLGDAVPMQANGGTTYSWAPTTGLSCTLCSNPTATPTITTTYTVTGTTSGCSSTATITITVDPNCCVLPNMPNYTNSNSLTLGPAAFNATTFCVNGTLTINTNTIFNECKIFLGPGAQIVVNNGFTLRIQSFGATPNCFSHLKAACGQMWNGILVNPTATLQLLSTPITNAVLIEDAINAVTSSNGGNVDVRGAWFNKDHIGILFLPFNGTHPSSVNRAVFTCRNLNNNLNGCPPSFIANLNNMPFTTLLPPYAGARTAIGIQVSFVTNITIGNLAPNNVNTFDNLDNGIISAVSNITIINNRFQNITPPFLQLNVPCQIGTAICANSTFFTNPIRNITVGGNLQSQGNSFFNCGQGIAIVDNMNSNIRNNQFTNVSTGITQKNCHNRTIDMARNTITDASVGMFIYNCPLSNTTLFRNTITLSNTNTNNNARGIWLQDIAPVIGGSASITQNGISEMRFGIRVENKNAPQIIDNGVTLKNITNPSFFGSGILTQYCTGGSLVESNHVFGYATGVCPLDASCSPTYSCSNAAWWLNGIRVDLSDFSAVECNDVQDCGDGFFAGGNMQNTFFTYNNMNGNLFRAMLGNWVWLSSQGSSSFGSDNIWNTSGTFAYNSYTLNPLVASSTFTGFNCFRVQNIPGGYNPGATGECSNLNPTFFAFKFPIAAGPSNLPPCPAFLVSPSVNVARMTIQDSIPFSIDTIPNRLLSKLNVYHGTRFNPLFAADPVLIHFRDSLKNTSVGTLDSVYSNLDIPMSNAVASSLSALNSSAIANDTITFWQKKVNHIALHNIAVNQNNYTSQELDRLRFIANKCPYRYGPVVYQARAILTSIDPFITEYWNDCEIPTPPSGGAGGRYAENNNTENRKSITAKLYPNPTDGDFYYEYNMEMGISGEITIFDMLGQLKFKASLSSGNNTLKVSDKNLTNGIYSVKVILSSGEEYVDKLIISK